MGKWYGGGGMMHQKVWIFDQQHLYLGSANMDWKSIAQVKEMGVVVEDCPELAADAGKYFEAWWAFAALSPTSVQVFDPVARIDRCVPPWSILVPQGQRAPSTLASGKAETAYNWKAPLSVNLGGERGTVLITGCPQEVLDSGRTWDQQGLVRTIDDARKSICVSVMDFAPVGLVQPSEPRRAARRRRRHAVRYAGMVVEPVRCAAVGGADFARFMSGCWSANGPTLPA